MIPKRKPLRPNNDSDIVTCSTEWSDEKNEVVALTGEEVKTKGSVVTTLLINKNRANFDKVLDIRD